MFSSSARRPAGTAEALWSVLRMSLVAMNPRPYLASIARPSSSLPGWVVSTARASATRQRRLTDEAPLLVFVEGLDPTVVAGLDWVDISSNSFGPAAGLPTGLLFGDPEPTKRAAERGQTTLFAAGNGMGLAWDEPIVTWHSHFAGDGAVGHVLFEGYGATPNPARRATDVLLGAAELPERPFEDDFFEADRSIRDSIWGGFDRTGDGQVDSSAMSPSALGHVGLSRDALTEATTVEDPVNVLRAVLLEQNQARESGRR